MKCRNCFAANLTGVTVTLKFKEIVPVLRIFGYWQMNRLKDMSDSFVVNLICDRSIDVLVVLVEFVAL